MACVMNQTKQLTMQACACVENKMEWLVSVNVIWPACKNIEEFMKPHSLTFETSTWTSVASHHAKEMKSIEIILSFIRVGRSKPIEQFD